MQFHKCYFLITTRVHVGKTKFKYKLKEEKWEMFLPDDEEM